MKILNFGSCNVDYVYSLDHIVTVGETASVDGMEKFPGGKGLNQSIAVARAGGQIWHAGCIGQDGIFLSELLAESGVNTDYLKRVEGPNGQAIIQVDKNGENCIFIYHGSNAMVDRFFVDEVLSHFDAGDIILLQNEISNLPYIIKQASRKGMQIVFNPSPFYEELKEMDLDRISYLVLNEVEAKGFSGQDDPQEMLRYMRERYPRVRVMLTLGKGGCIYSEGEKTLHHPAYRVETVDTTAAGDTFTGYFVALLASGLPYEDILRYASLASAIAVSRKGAAPSIPIIKEVEAIAPALVPYEEDSENRASKQKKKILTYVESTLSEATLNGLAHKMGYSLQYTGVLVKRLMGVSFSELLQEKRCAAAAKLLKKTDLSVQEIIHRVGYKNESFFREIFKSRYGESPLTYRKKQK
ncbi:MAG: helix-turn-helix domain-containing protein [Clostridia bacterium]|nr:helix-turn-helix domain-containing protein [Clostridia bacterium]